MNTTIKGIRQELLYSDKSFLLSEFLMPSKASSFRKIKEIAYCYGDHGRFGYLRFHGKNGSVETFLFRKNKNEQVSEFLDTVQIGYPDVKLNEQYEMIADLHIITCPEEKKHYAGYLPSSFCWVHSFST